MRQWFPNPLLSGRILRFFGFSTEYFLFFFFFSFPLLMGMTDILINGSPISMDDPPPGSFQEVDPINTGSGLLRIPPSARYQAAFSLSWSIYRSRTPPLMHPGSSE